MNNKEELDFIWKVAQAPTLKSALSEAIMYLLHTLSADSVHIVAHDGPTLLKISLGESSRVFVPEEGNITSVRYGKSSIEPPIFESDTSRSIITPYIKNELIKKGIQSYSVQKFSLSEKLNIFLELQFISSQFAFSSYSQQVVHFVVSVIKEYSDKNHSPGISINSDQEIVKPSDPHGNLPATYARLLSYGELIILRTDKSLNVLDVVGDSYKRFGVTPEMFKQRGSIWKELMYPTDRRSLVQLLRESLHTKAPVDKEIRIFHQVTGETRWFLMRAVPLLNVDGSIRGWEGFGFDVTSKKRVEEKLIQSTSRLHALLMVTQTLSASLHAPQLLYRTSVALKKVISDIDSIVTIMFDGDEPEISSSIGLSEERINDISVLLVKESALLNSFFDTLSQDELTQRAQRLLNLMKSTDGNVATLTFDSKKKGLFIVSSKTPLALEDNELIEAVASQLGIVIHQSELLTKEKVAKDEVEFLYHFVHQLSRYTSVKEISDHALPILSEYLNASRMWIGVLNDSGTHIVGQSALGPMMNSTIAGLQIELSLKHQFLDEAVQTKSPVIVPEGVTYDCSKLNNIIKKIKPKSFLITPLISLGRVVGVWVFEPKIPSETYLNRRMPLFQKITSELASLIVARKLESKISSSERMKTAGMLASGVSHYFNNILQVVMGQAGVIQMQSDPSSKVFQSSQSILEAAQRGAQMISQLAIVSSPQSSEKENIEINQFLFQSRDFYRSVLGNEIKLEYSLDAELPEINVATALLQQSLTSIISNSKDALVDRVEPKVTVTTKKVWLRSGEIDPELPPGEFIVIEVKDNGVGMTPEVVKKCFEPFFTTKSQGIDEVSTRTGLGLSSTFSVMKSHGGIITVTSSPEQGSIFKLYFPVPITQTALKQLSSDSHDVVVVSRNSSLIETIRVHLTSFGLSSYAMVGTENINEMLSSNPPWLLVVDPDTAEQEAGMVIQKCKEFKTRILLPTEHPVKWKTLIEGLPHIEVIQKPFGPWSIYSKLSSYVQENGSEQAPPLRKQIEKNIEEK